MRVEAVKFDRIVLGLSNERASNVRRAGEPIRPHRSRHTRDNEPLIVVEIARVSAPTGVILKRTRESPSSCVSASREGRRRFPCRRRLRARAKNGGTKVALYRASRPNTHNVGRRRLSAPLRAHNYPARRVTPRATERSVLADREKYTLTLGRDAGYRSRARLRAHRSVGRYEENPVHLSTDSKMANGGEECARSYRRGRRGQQRARAFSTSICVADRTISVRTRD